MKTKAAVLYEINRPLVIEELEIPPLKRGQVLVKVLYSGICHSQLNEIKGLKGEDKYLPHLLGHEGSGIIEEIGESVTKVKKGDYVVLTWIKGKGIDAGGSVYLKDNIKINSGPIATFSEYSIISENRLVKIPKDVPTDVAALLGCAIPTGAGIVKNEINLKENDSLAIFGIGGIGSCALLYAKSLNCSTIIAVDIVDSKLEFAKEIGATHIINPRKENPIKKIKEITKGTGVDYAIECSGVKSAMEQAFESIKDKGKTIIAGNLKKGEKISIDPFELIKGKKIQGSWGGLTDPDIDIPYYIELYKKGLLNINALISDVISLDEINQGFKHLEEENKIRILIKMAT